MEQRIGVLIFNKDIFKDYFIEKSNVHFFNTDTGMQFFR